MAPDGTAEYTCWQCRKSKVRSLFPFVWYDWEQPVCQECCETQRRAATVVEYVTCHGCCARKGKWNFPAVRRIADNLPYDFPDDFCMVCLFSRGWPMNTWLEQIVGTRQSEEVRSEQDRRVQEQIRQTETLAEEMVNPQRLNREANASRLLEQAVRLIELARNLDGPR